MFRCSVCSKVVPPRVKPTRVGLTRRTTYSNQVVNPETEETETKASSGFEYRVEHSLCPICAGIELRDEVKPDFSGYTSIIKGIQSHARACKKFLEECKACSKNLLDLKTFPAPAISQGLEDMKAPGLKSSLAYTLVESMMRKAKEVDRGSKRAKADFETAFNVLKVYESNGGSL